MLYTSKNIGDLHRVEKVLFNQTDITGICADCDDGGGWARVLLCTSENLFVTDEAGQPIEIIIQGDVQVFLKDEEKCQPEPC